MSILTGRRFVKDPSDGYTRADFLAEKRLSAGPAQPRLEVKTRQSILVDEAKRYLIIKHDYQPDRDRAKLMVESALIAGRCRAAFGTFDEADQHCCALKIKGVMRTQQEDYVARVMREAKERDERDERLRHWLGN